MKNNKGFAPIIIVFIIVAMLAVGGVTYYVGKSLNSVSQDGKEITIGCVSIETTAKNPQTGEIKTFSGPCDVPKGWKIVDPIYTNTKLGYSFQYPEKLHLSTSGDVINLSHEIPFENYDGGCDMKGDSELSETLNDFNLSIRVISGEVKPSYFDGNYSKGILNGKWSYVGAEGCGQTSYYFPITGNRTLVVTKAEIQILSNVVAPDVKAKVLAVPGVISYEESKVIIDQILSTFKFVDQTTNMDNTDIGFASRTLATYFELLGSKQYFKAVKYTGFNIDFVNSCYSPSKGTVPGDCVLTIDPSNIAELLKIGCETYGLQCLKIKNTLSQKQISSTEFEFVVQFANNNGTLFKRGPCCGATEEQMPTETNFKYTVKKENDNFLIMTSPVYVP